MPLPAPYIPTINPLAPVAPVTAHDVQAVALNNEAIQTSQYQNRLRSMIEQEAMADRKVNSLAAAHAMLAPPAQPHQAPTAPAGMTPAPPPTNPLAAVGAPDPQASAAPADVHQTFLADRADPNTPDPTEPHTDPYAVVVPDRAPRSWLMQQAREGKIDPLAAIKYDTETQALIGEQTKFYQTQGAQYGAVVADEVNDYLKKGDMKGLRSVYEQMRKELPNNPLARQKADHMIAFIDKGGTVGEGGVTTYPVMVSESNLPVVRKKYLEAGGDPRMTPTVGETWDFTDQQGKTIGVKQSTVGVGKEPASSQAAWMKGRIVELRKKGMTPEAAEIQAAREYEDRLDKRKENTTRVTVQLHESAKEQGEIRKEGRKKEAERIATEAAMKDPGTDLAATYYAIYGRLPPGLSRSTDKARIKAIEGKAVALTKRWNLTPSEWAAMTTENASAQKAMAKIDTINAQVQRDEETAKTLLKRVVSQGRDISRSATGYKKVDDWVNHLKANYEGDPKAVNIENTIYEALVDYGKVMGGNVGAGGLTDSARVEAQRLLTAGMAGGKHIDSIVKNMVDNMKVRTSSNQKIHNHLRNVISHIGNDGEDAPTELPAGVTKDAIAAELARRGRK